jgi:hypothetical protein
MSECEWYDIVLSASVGLILACTLVMLLVVLPVTMVADAGCLRAGYPKASVTWNFTRYCIKRVDQTDVVVPYAWATREVYR